MRIILIAQIAATFFNFPFRGMGIVISCLLAVIALEIQLIRKHQVRYTQIEAAAVIGLWATAAAAFMYFLSHSLGSS